MVEVELFFEDLKANGAAERTISSYRSNLDRFMKKMNIKKAEQIEKVRKADIQSYRIDMEESGLSNATINTYIAPVVSFFRFLYNEGIIEKDITIGITSKKVPPKPMTFLTEAEAKLLIENCNTLKQKAMFYLMVNTGMRVSEVINIKMGDIKDGKIYINNAKRGETRYIPVSKTCIRYINDYIGREPLLTLGGKQVYDKNGDPVYTDGERVPPVIPKLSDADYLFTSVSGAQMERSGINRQLKRACHRAGIKKDVSPHKLRSTAATIQCIHGTNFKNIQTMLGHKSQAMTARYTQMVDEVYQREISNNGLWEDEDEGEQA